MKREVTRDEFIRKRQERQRKIRKRRLTAFFIILIIILLSVGAVLSLTVFFPIESLSVSGSKIYSPEEILEKSDISKGDNLFSLSRSATEKKLKSKLPYIEKVTFKRELPGTLKINVKDGTEFAVYKVGEQYFTVSREGWVMKKSAENTQSLICINAKNVKCKVGSEIGFEDLAQKELIETINESLKNEKINCNSIDTTNIIALTLRVEDRFDVNLGNSNNIPEKIKHLAVMIKEIDGDKSGKINLSMWTNTNTKGHFVAENQ